MLYEKKSSVRQNFVRSDKISNSVRPMSDKTLEYFDSTGIEVTQPNQDNCSVYFKNLDFL